MKNDRIEIVTSFIKDPALQSLLKDITVSTVDWNSFLNRSIPQGLTTNISWELIHRINQSAGTNLPEFLPGRNVFYRFSMRIIQDIISLYHLLTEIIRMEDVDTLGNSKEIRCLCVHDTIAAARFDGLDIDERSVFEKWNWKKKKIIGEASSADEQLVLNALSVDATIENLSEKPLTGKLIGEISKQVWGSVNPQDVSSRRNSRFALIPPSLDPLILVHMHEPRPDENRIEERTDAVANYLEGLTSEDTDLSPIRSLLASDIIATFIPLGSVSSLVGKIIEKIMLYKTNIPMISWMFLNGTRFSWENSRTDNLGFDYSKEDIIETRRHEQPLNLYDITPMQTINLQIALKEIERLHSYINALNQRTQRIKEALRSSSYFNQRQCAILARAAKSHENTFSIRYHEANNGISYATARRDLQDLFDSGYLMSDFMGNTQVFKASKDMEHRLCTMVGIDYSVFNVESSLLAGLGAARQKIRIKGQP